jgi:hypothetical protein
VPLRLDGAQGGWQLLDLLAEAHDARRVDLSDDGRCELTLEGYGYRWLRVLTPESRRLA